MPLKKLVLKNFRNMEDLFLEFSCTQNNLIGPNGSGKTNILEAIHLLCTGRSQRNALKNEMIRFGAPSARIDGEFSEKNDPSEQKRFSLCFDRENSMTMKINDRKMLSITEWFGMQPLVSFAADDIDLVYGNPERRRRFLDMFISLMDKEYLRALLDYRKNLASRNKLFKTGMDDVLCDIYEKNMSEAAATIVERRIEATGELARKSRETYGEISGNKDAFSMVYKSDFSCDNSSKNSWKKVFYTMLGDTRNRDCFLGFSTCGPHRDDLLLFINEKTAKSYASQGQCRSVAFSLKVSSMEYLEKWAQNSMLLIFDDAVADLDPCRAARLFSLIEKRGQLFIASPQRGASALPEAREYCLHEGRVRQA